MATCYLVLGTPRSGTSLVAGILHCLGVRMGEYIGKDDDGVTDRWDFAEPDDWNPKGFFEDAAFVNFGAQVYGFPPEKPRRLNEKERAILSELIGKRSKLGVDWGGKEASISFYLDDFSELCHDELKLIVVDRDPSKSAQSWCDRSGDSLAKSAALIDSVKSAVTNRKLAPTLNVAFDDLVNRPTETVEAIAAFIGREVTKEALAMPDESLRHY